MVNATQSKLAFRGIDVVNLQFTASRPYDQEAVIDLDITPHVFFPEGQPEQFKLVMDVKLDSESFFSLSSRAIGYFEVEGGLDEELRSRFINHNAAAIMFPYVRSFLSTFSASVGNTLGLIHIPTQFFKGEIPELRAANDDNTQNTSMIEGL